MPRDYWCGVKGGVAAGQGKVRQGGAGLWVAVWWSAVGGNSRSDYPPLALLDKAALLSGLCNLISPIPKWNGAFFNVYRALIVIAVYGRKVLKYKCFCGAYR